MKKEPLDCNLFEKSLFLKLLERKLDKSKLIRGLDPGLQLRLKYLCVCVYSLPHRSLHSWECSIENPNY